MQVELRRARHPMIGPLLDNHVSPIVIPFVRLLQQLETFDKDNYTFTFLTFHEEEKLCTEICIYHVSVYSVSGNVNFYLRSKERLYAVSRTNYLAVTYERVGRNFHATGDDPPALTSDCGQV